MMYTESSDSKIGISLIHIKYGFEWNQSEWNESLKWTVKWANR